MVSECPRPSNSWKSVTADDFAYRLKAALALTYGTVWSAVPAVISRGPRAELSVLTATGERREKLAVAASNRGLPGDGMAQRSHSASDSAASRALPKP